MRDQATEAAVSGIAQKASMAGGGLALYGGLTASDIAAFGGLLIAFVGLCVQFYYKRKGDRRATELHAARLQRLLDGEDEDE